MDIQQATHLSELRSDFGELPIHSRLGFQERATGMSCWLFAETKESSGCCVLGPNLLPFDRGQLVPIILIYQPLRPTLQSLFPLSFFLLPTTTCNSLDSSKSIFSASGEPPFHRGSVPELHPQLLDVSFSRFDPPPVVKSPIPIQSLLHNARPERSLVLTSAHRHITTHYPRLHFLFPLYIAKYLRG